MVTVFLSNIVVFLEFSVCVLSRVRFFSAPWTVTYQTSLSPTLAGRFFTINEIFHFFNIKSGFPD